MNRREESFHHRPRSWCFCWGGESSVHAAPPVGRFSDVITGTMTSSLAYKEEVAEQKRLSAH